jgi:glutamate carboxypeptidase
MRLMANRDHPALAWIETQRDRMIRLVAEWAGINSGSYNLDGLGKMASRLMSEYGALGGKVTTLDLPSQEVIDTQGKLVSMPLGQAISIRKRPSAPLRVFLGIHMDTVYGPADPFQHVERIDNQTLRGPGVIDAKGGLAVMLIALEALERSDFASRIGWEVLINPDEEIGSPGSANLFVECARRNHLGLVFEPALADGAMVSVRKGSGNFSVVVRGRSAHAGRDFAAGRNAIVAAADFALAASRMNGTIPDATINVGRIDGGGPVNVVPDLAIVRLNVRVAKIEDQQRIEKELNGIAADVAARHDVTLTIHGGFLSPPKLLDDRTRELCERIEECGRELEVPIRWGSSGGVSDGNKLAAAGLPVIDTMGPRGGKLHSPQEFLILDSLTERAKLCALLLLKLASGDVEWATAG